ncbi:hypothetical protein SVIO_101080 [Streptomyces violaceusniger]|uniref:Uncharacterized protein n=1 Tax=Streptomyces violaceusniger TaxID=68280 RepID=A0A4D4LEG4_STRVO|nr:hypothetical protein SVIO_101080 [Streptomyces violaceusniger]
MNGASVAEVSTLLALGLQDKIVANQQTYGMSEVADRAAAIKHLPTGDIKLNEAYDIPARPCSACAPISSCPSPRTASARRTASPPVSS